MFSVCFFYEFGWGVGCMKKVLVSENLLKVYDLMSPNEYYSVRQLFLLVRDELLMSQSSFYGLVNQGIFEGFFIERSKGYTRIITKNEELLEAKK